MLSFRVTDQALTAHGVHIELCDGDVGIADPVAHGIIPGEVTVQLMYHLSSRDLHAGDHCPPPVSDSQERDSDYSSDSTVRCASRVESASGTENTARRAISSGVVVKVRLFAEADGEDVGTCVLNLKFRSDLPNKQRMHTPTTATKTSPNTRRDLEEQDLFENVGQETMSQGVEEVTTVNEMAEAKNGDRRYMKGEGTAATSTDADTLFASEGGAADPIEHATAPHEQMGKAIVEVETAPRTFAAAAVEVHEQRRNRECSLELLAETAKHIEAIEEVRLADVNDPRARFSLFCDGGCPVSLSRLTKITFAVLCLRMLTKNQWRHDSHMSCEKHRRAIMSRATTQRKRDMLGVILSVLRG